LDGPVAGQAKHSEPEQRSREAVNKFKQSKKQMPCGED